MRAGNAGRLWLHNTPIAVTSEAAKLILHAAVDEQPQHQHLWDVVVVFLTSLWCCLASFLEVLPECPVVCFEGQLRPRVGPAYKITDPCLHHLLSMYSPKQHTSVSLRPFQPTVSIASFDSLSASLLCSLHDRKLIYNSRDFL